MGEGRKPTAGVGKAFLVVKVAWPVAGFGRDRVKVKLVVNAKSIAN